MTNEEYIIENADIPPDLKKIILQNKLSRHEKKINREAQPNEAVHVVADGNRVFFTIGSPLAQGKVANAREIWLEATRLIEAGLKGLEDERFSKWFGEHKRWSTLRKTLSNRIFSSNPSAYQRRGKVKEKLQAMQAALQQNWIVEEERTGGRIASANPKLGAMNVSLRLESSTSALYAGGFFVHEIGHLVGLVDVCATCDKSALGPTLKVQPDNRVFKSCGSLDHGRKFHYIGTKRAVELMEVAKNATVWNTDNYRWFCLSFFPEETIEAMVALVGESQAEESKRFLRRGT